MNRLIPLRDKFDCHNLDDLESARDLSHVIAEHEITDLIDMTNMECKSKTSECSVDSGAKIESVPIRKLLHSGNPTADKEQVRLFTPVFTTPTDIREHKACRPQSRSPILPGIVYPF